MSPSPVPDLDFLRVVSEDLDALSERWTPSIDDVSLRQLSGILRSLLIEDYLQIAANQLGKRVRILTPAPAKALDAKEIRGMRFYQAGGGNAHGLTIWEQTVRFGVAASASTS